MMLDSCNFELDEVVQIPIIDYYKTIKEHWRNNVKSNRVFLENITSVKHVRDFKLYLKGILHIFNQGVFSCQLVSSKKISRYKAVVGSSSEG